jgi:hypothetical protein
VNVGLEGAVAADLPIFFPTPSASVGSLDITIGDLSDIAGSLSITAPNLSQIGLDMDLPNNMGALLDGIGQLLDHLQAALGSQVLSARLPLVGDKLGQAVDFIGGTLRTNIYDKLKAEFDAALAAGQSVTLQVAQQALYDSLGPAGLDILDVTTSFGDYRDISVTSDGEGIDATRIEFKLHLNKNATLVSIPLNFDLGLPALGLSADGKIQLTAGYDINLWFGVDKSDGFFLDTSSPKEVTLDISAAIPGATLTGNLGFLQVQLKDKSSNPTHLTGEFSINLNAPGTT